MTQAGKTRLGLFVLPSVTLFDELTSCGGISFDLFDHLTSLIFNELTFGELSYLVFLMSWFLTI